MENDYTRYLHKRFLALGIYQVAGGALGFYGLISLLFEADVSIVLTPWFIVIFLLFSYSILCGILLMQKKEQALKYSLVNQYLQLFAFYINGYMFSYASGIGLYLGIDLSDSFRFIIDASLSAVSFLFNGNTVAFQITFNFAALIALVMIYNLKKTIEDRDTAFQIEQLGKAETEHN